MNTKPDDLTLALWMEDELEGHEFDRVEAWAAGLPDQIAAREENRRWRKQAAALLPREIDPPYPDFFNSRVLAAIGNGRQSLVPVPVPAEKKSWWKAAWFMPATAAAGMALAFWAGHHTAPGTSAPVVLNDGAPMVYTPDSGVQASYYAGRNGSSTVIVLDGVSAIPDNVDFKETAWTSPGRGAETTAYNEADADGGGLK